MLEYVNIVSTLLEGVKLCHQNCTTELIVNGSLSPPVWIESSVKEGFPTFPLLFALYFEPFALCVPLCIYIHCYKLLDCEIIRCWRTPTIFYIFLSVIRDVCTAIGVTISLDKCRSV